MSAMRTSAVLSLGVFLFGCSVALAASPRDDDVVAVVNGTSIYRRSVRAIVQGTILSQDSETGPDAATVRRLATDALESLIDFELLFQASQAREISVGDDAVDAEVKRTRTNFVEKKAFEEALKSQGITETELRSDTRKSLAVNRLLEGEVLREAHITQEQVEQYYAANKEQFRHPTQTRASHILIRATKETSKGQATARGKAEQILDLVQGGADFAEVARTHSEDPGSAQLGGDLGFFAAGEMDDAFEKAASALEKGQLSGVINSTYGFHIIKVTDRRDAGYDALPEVQERIRAALLKSERRKRQAEFVAELRKSAKIQYPAPL